MKAALAAVVTTVTSVPSLCLKAGLAAVAQAKDQLLLLRHKMYRSGKMRRPTTAAPAPPAGTSHDSMRGVTSVTSGTSHDSTRGERTGQGTSELAAEVAGRSSTTSSGTPGVTSTQADQRQDNLVLDECLEESDDEASPACLGMTVGGPEHASPADEENYW